MKAINSYHDLKWRRAAMGEGKALRARGPERSF